MFYINETRFHGRPLTKETRTAMELASYDLLDSLSIEYDRVDHDHADTIEACHAVEAVLGWPICKNLFLCNRQKTQYYMLMLEGDKVFKTKDLSKQLGVSRLSFATGEDMEAILGVHPGSVTVLGLMNDKENKVQLVMDKPIYDAPFVSCHPCISTSTLTIKTEDLLQKLLPAMGHEPIVVDLPIPEEE
ncbi:MAG: prolyl-tRNA synthetase associated domain-containing protein [Oscillospiraceae bacterium]|nr:prolyl-tRNA synthetase associated domain-containing protein [Oscillospiraceae bacterium]